MERKWLENFKQKNVKNQDLWIKLDEEIMKHNIEWNWVKGHSNNQLNEKADSLARKFIEEHPKDYKLRLCDTLLLHVYKLFQF